MQIQHIGVVGAGQMGSGIAQVCAQAGLTVTLVDVHQAALSRARDTIARSLARLVKKARSPRSTPTHPRRASPTTMRLPSWRTASW